MRDLKNLQPMEPPTRWMRVRVFLLGAVFFTLLVGVFARATNLQVNQKDRLKAYAEDQYVRAMEIPARRGEIVDRRGVKLASSVEVDSVWSDPSMLPDVRAASRQLAKVLGIDGKELQERLEKGRRFAWVKRQVTDGEAARVKALGLPGIGFAKEPRRFYPQRELAAHVVGLVGTDSHGLDGLELSFEDELSGERVKRAGFRDAKGRKLLTNGVDESQSSEGANLTLTIDSTLQYVTERALEKAVVDAKAAAGTAVVLDPRTGEILALANWPRFNPNSPRGSDSDAFRNRAASDAFEPGSTFKAFVIASALDRQVISESSEFDCEKGSFRIGRNVVHDTHPHGLLQPRGILQVSSNIGVTKVAQKMGRDKLVETYKSFGFGERFGLGLPGEGKGAIPFPRAEIALATQSFGQGISATAVQIAAGYGALANDGVLMKPYLVSKVVDADGVVLLENKPVAVRRAVSVKAARSVVSMLESVVEQGGTAPRARMEEYRVAGKTGTAQKVDPIARGYSDKRIASFVGIVPAEDPRAVILIVIDEPKTDVYGGLVAAPAFKEIALQAMPHLGAPVSREAPPVKVVAARPEPKGKSVVVLGLEKLEQMDTVTEEVVSEGSVRVPDVKGLAGRAAVAQLLTAALEPHLAGSGRVVSQKPAAGSLVDKGTRITVELAGHLPASPR
ncbi:MAG: penicillin-binding protein [Archangium sp.]|nr:penicillin-binding protein [Archangium sp.]MDP3156318.1 penicillin-binding protein [Archangium sp.]MDP3570362.1 penicillin-binding protein [Archangium sp.]